MTYISIQQQMILAGVKRLTPQQKALQSIAPANDQRGNGIIEARYYFFKPDFTNTYTEFMENVI